MGVCLTFLGKNFYMCFWVVLYLKFRNQDVCHQNFSCKCVFYRPECKITVYFNDITYCNKLFIILTTIVPNFMKSDRKTTLVLAITNS